MQPHLPLLQVVLRRKARHWLSSTQGESIDSASESKGKMLSNNPKFKRRITTTEFVCTFKATLPIGRRDVLFLALALAYGRVANGI